MPHLVEPHVYWLHQAPTSTAQAKQRTLFVQEDIIAQEVQFLALNAHQDSTVLRDQQAPALPEVSAPSEATALILEVRSMKILVQ